MEAVTYPVTGGLLVRGDVVLKDGAWLLCLHDAYYIEDSIWDVQVQRVRPEPGQPMRFVAHFSDNVEYRVIPRTVPPFPDEQ